MKNKIRLLKSKIGGYKYYPVLTLFMFFASNVLGQFAGWPSGSGNPEVDASSIAINTKVYTDDNRARVLDITLVSSSPDIYDIEIAPPKDWDDVPNYIHPCSLAFSSDKWCLLIQMEDHTTSGTTTVGNHTRVTIVSYNCSTKILRVVAPYGLPTFSVTANDRIQISRVPIYWDMDLDPGGELTCRPYDHEDGTGGITALIVANELNFNGGIINSAAKGYHVGWSSSTPLIGQGGVGNAAPAKNSSANGGWPGGPHAGPIDNAYTPGNGVPMPAGTDPPIDINDINKHGYLCKTGGGSALEFSFDDLNLTANPLTNIRNGDNGEGPDDSNRDQGTNTDFNDVEIYSPSDPDRSSNWTTLRMGDAGLPGISGGDGAGAGGYGGDGGVNSLETFLPAPFQAQPGFSGFDGNPGGKAAPAARGGGIILLKAKSYIVNVSTKFLFVDGENGRTGQTGGDGGRGGNGGDGTAGGCNSGDIVPSGGVGGTGLSGVGAQGGDGGNGGNSGTIWIMKNSTGNQSLSSKVSIKGGRAGRGGIGGYSTKYLTLPLANNYYDGLSLTTVDALIACNLGSNKWTFCQPPPPSYTIEICNCNKVFEQLYSLNGTSGIQADANNFRFIDPTNGSSFPVYYEESHHGQQVLYYTQTGSPNIRFNCYMRDGSLYDIMVKKMLGITDLVGYKPGISYLGVGANVVSMTGSKTIISFYDGTNTWKLFEYEPEVYPTQVGVLTDFDDPSKSRVETSNCYYNYRFSGAGSWSGSGLNPYGPREPIEYDEVTGEEGEDGEEGMDGEEDFEFFEDEDFAPLIRPENQKKYFEKIQDNNLVNVSLLIDPVGGGVTIVSTPNSPEMGDIAYELYTVDGRLIQTSSAKGRTTFNLAAGVYLLKVSMDNKVEIHKIIVL